jgi:hypothetical protein
MNLKDYLTESFSKEYAYRIRLACDCGPEQMDVLEKCLQKYNFVSAAPWNRTPIQENPSEFVRLKGVRFTSEVSSTDVVLKYPANPRILEVWLAVNMGLDHDRVIVYGIDEPRRQAADTSEARMAKDLDRYANMDDALLAEEEMSHEYYAEQMGNAVQEVLYGEEHNEKFLAELQKIKNAKGADYFRNYPSKDEMMGDNMWTLWGELHNGTNMGKGTETKEVSVNDQNSGRR